jgi:hypothetical protein
MTAILLSCGAVTRPADRGVGIPSTSIVYSLPEANMWAEVGRSNIGTSDGYKFLEGQQITSEIAHWRRRAK